MTKNWIEELGQRLVDFIQVKDSANIDYFIELVNHECLSDDTNTLIKINRKLSESIKYQIHIQLGVFIFTEVLTNQKERTI